MANSRRAPRAELLSPWHWVQHLLICSCHPPGSPSPQSELHESLTAMVGGRAWEFQASQCSVVPVETSSPPGICQSPHSNKRKFQRSEALWHKVDSKTNMGQKTHPRCSKNYKGLSSSVPGAETKTKHFIISHKPQHYLCKTGDRC